MSTYETPIQAGELSAATPAGAGAGDALAQGAGSAGDAGAAYSAAGQPGALEAAALSREAQSVDLDQVDLTRIPKFRKYQAEMDRKLAEFQRQAAQEREDREKLEAERIEALPPEEQVAYLRRRLNQQDRQGARQAEAQARLAEMQAAVAEAGLQWTDQRIWADPEVATASAGKDLPDDAAVKAVQRACLRIARTDLEAARKAAQVQSAQAQQAAAVAGQRAATRALNEAGVTATSQASPVIAPGSARDAKVEQFARRWKSVKGQGCDSPSYRRFMSDLREAGLTVTDIGYRV